MFNIGTSEMNIVQENSSGGGKKWVRRVLILDVARQAISDKGLRSLKIRDIATGANCSIGSVYNEFGDFDGVILTVNRETVTKLSAILARVPDADPYDHLLGLAASYLDFAMTHGNLLRSLFEHRMEGDRPFPEDLLQMVMNTFALMYPPLRRLLPGRQKKDVALLARMMFSAVHGIISLGLEERLVAVPPKSLHRHISQFVETHLAGLGVVRPKTRGKRS
jgi:AcrR family transcriptional regulator